MFSKNWWNKLLERSKNWQFKSQRARTHGFQRLCDTRRTLLQKSFNKTFLSLRL